MLRTLECEVVEPSRLVGVDEGPEGAVSLGHSVPGSANETEEKELRVVFSGQLLRF